MTKSLKSEAVEINSVLYAAQAIRTRKTQVAGSKPPTEKREPNGQQKKGIGAIYSGISKTISVDSRKFVETAHL